MSLHVNKKFGKLLIILCLAGVTVQIEKGKKACKKKFPYMVSLRNLDSALPHFCAGSIIHENWILTAAHCVEDHKNDPGAIEVKAGTIYLRGHKGTFYYVKRIVIHPKFDSKTKANDIALLELKEKITFTDRINKVNLAMTEDLVKPNILALAPGWGKLSNRCAAKSPEVLYFMQVRIGKVFKPEDDQLNIGPLIWTRTEFSGLCDLKKGDVKNTKEICCLRLEIFQGDSGGPLVAEHTQIGISVETRNYFTGTYDVFTSVYNYKDWIEEIVY